MLRRAETLLLGLALVVAGCAREAPAARTPNPGFMPWITPPGYAWPPRTVAKKDRMHPGLRAEELSKTAPVTTPNRPPLPSDSLIPGSGDCVDRLRERYVRFEALPAERGVDTPILVHGPLGGVEYWSVGGPMVVDCRMALALERVAPEFLALGITRARFSGAYVYRTSKQGRLSLHAYGLAVDMHEVTTPEGTYSVKKDFQRGLENGCAEGAPVLNRLACHLRALGLFRELLTPDYDADHQDHLHLGLAPLPGARLRPDSSSNPEPEMTSQNRPGKARPQVKTSGKRVDRPALHVKRPAAGTRVARLGSNLQDATHVSGDRVSADASDEAR
jgi:hypothetical protein